jgi:hypothetical protein
MDDSKDISFSNLTDAISAVDYNYNTIDLTDLNSGITVAGQTYTMAPLTVSMPTVSISSISGANVGYSNNMWTTGTSGFNGTSVADLNQAGMLSLRGEKADIDINGRSLMKTLDALQERLNMLTPNPEMEAEWDQLRELGERYRELEQQCREKTQMWNKLKSMPKPNVKL